MTTSDRFDRKRRRPKPRNCRQRRSFLRKPWFLKFLMVQFAPAAVKIVEVAIEVIQLFRK
jgi:hypothetical protein